VDEYRDEWASNSTELKEKTPMFALVARHLVLKKKTADGKSTGKIQRTFVPFERGFERGCFSKREPQKGLQMVG